MNGYQIEIAKREQIIPLFSYPYKVTPLSEQAKLLFALYNKKRGPLERNGTSELIKKYLNVENFPFIGQLTFFHDDPKETDELRKEMAREHAKKVMADYSVPGITHLGSSKRTYYVPLVEGTDYEIEVSEKIVHEQKEILTFDDIKAL